MAIKRCVCRNEYQDERYGFGNRVANPTDIPGVHHCTSCGMAIKPAVPKKIKKVDDADDPKGKKKKRG